MPDYPTDEVYFNQPDRLISDLNGMLLQGDRDVPALLVQAIARNAGKYGPVLKLGRRLNRLGAFDALLPLMDAALKRFPNSIDLAVLLADCRLALGQPPDLDRLIALTEDSGRKRSLTADRLLQSGDPDRALALLGTTGGADEFIVEDLLAHAQIARLSGYLDLAQSDMRALRSVHGQSVEAWRGILQMIGQQDGPIAALAEFEKAPVPKSEIAPAMLWLLMSSALHMVQEFYDMYGGETDLGWQMKCRLQQTAGDAEAAFETCLDKLGTNIDQDWSEADFTLRAQTALDVARYDDVETTLTAGLRIYPISSRLIHLAGQLRFRKGDWKAARMFLEDKARDYPGNAGLYRNILLQTGEYALAATLENAAKDPRLNESEQRFRLRLARATGDIAGVFAASKALERSSYSSRERARIASLEALVLEGKLSDALGDSQTALDMFPFSEDLLILCGKIAFLSGEIEMAMSLRERFHALSGKNVPTLDTPDLVVRLAQQAQTTNEIIRQADRLENALDTLLTFMPDADNPTVWMQFMYRWMQTGAKPEISGPRQIPDILLSYWEGEMNEAVATIMSEWQAMFPDAKHRHFDFADALAWLVERDMGETVRLLKAAEFPATRADIFRLAFLAEMGGIYFDTDERPLAAIDDWLEGCDLVLVAEKGHFTMANSFIACIPRHPVIIACLDRILAEGSGFEGGLATWIETGPALLTRETGSFIHKQISETGSVTDVRLLMPQEYTGRIATTLKLPHKFLSSHWRYSDD